MFFFRPRIKRLDAIKNWVSFPQASPIDGPRNSVISKTVRSPTRSASAPKNSSRRWNEFDWPLPGFERFYHLNDSLALYSVVVSGDINSFSRRFPRADEKSKLFKCVMIHQAVNGLEANRDMILDNHFNQTYDRQFFGRAYQIGHSVMPLRSSHSSASSFHDPSSK